jgi:CHAT domain-containing protein/lipopolysaccharide biosynthesis regulator YciM
MIGSTEGDGQLLATSHTDEELKCPQNGKSLRPTYRFACFILILFLPTLLVHGNRGFGNAINATASPKPQDVKKLEPGKRLSGELAGNQTRSYEITVSAGQFLHVVVEQLGIDVVVVLYDSNGKRVAEVDSPNGTQGPEPLLIIVETSGVYRLEIRSLEQAAPTGRYEARIEALREATEADRKKVSDLDDLKVADQLTDRVLELNRQTKYEEAITLAQRVLAIRERVLGGDHPQVAAALNNLAEMYKNRGDYSTASQFHERALKIKQRVLGENDLSTATSYLNLAEVYREMGKFERAEPLYKRAVTIYQARLGEDHPTLAQALNNLALLYDLIGNYRTSESLYLRALAIREKALGIDHPDTGITLVNLADLYREMGDLLKAEEFGARALGIFEKTLGHDHPYVATALNELGLVCVGKGDFTRAETLYLRSIGIREKALGTEHPEVAAALVNLAALYSRAGDAARALQLYLRILSIDEKAYGKEHPNIASDLSNLAYLFESLGQRARAEPVYLRALAITEKAVGLEHPQVATIVDNLALLYHQNGDWKKALPLAERALTIREKSLGPLHSHVANSLSTLAALYEAKGDAAKAVQLRHRGNHIREHNLSLILAVGSEREKASYMATFADETDLTVSLQNRSAPTNPEATSLALTTILRRKGRILDAMSEQIAILRHNFDGETQALFDKLGTLNRQLAGLTLRGPKKEGQSEFRTRIATLQTEAERLQAAMARKSLRFRLQSQPVTIEQLQSAIPTNAALVEMVNFSPYDHKSGVFTSKKYCAYILRKEGLPLWVDLGDAAKIDSNIDKLRKALSDRSNPDVRSRSRELEEQVFRPIRKILGETNHIFLSPDAALNLIPFAALVDEQGRHLLETYSITYLTTGRDLLRLQFSPESRQPPLVIANPLFDTNLSTTSAQTVGPANVQSGRRSKDIRGMKFNLLPGTAAEAKALAQILAGAEVLTQEKATEAALRRATAPSILHLATHGFFLPAELAESPSRKAVGARSNDIPMSLGSENPLLRSGLALAGANLQPDESGDDGILTALEVSGLDLWGTKLVVLSACETGLGEVKNSEGVYGLRRALVLAGSETQVMSLWKVSDFGTRDLMVAYYNRLKKGEGRAEALRQVQLMMLRGQLKPTLGSRKRGTTDTGEKFAPKDYQHPYYWAAFIQSGDWRIMESK